MRNGNIQLTQSLWSTTRDRAFQNDKNTAERFSPTVSLDRWGSLRAGHSRMDASVFSSDGNNANSGLVHGWGQCAPRAGSSDGCDVGPIGGRSSDGSPRFDQEVKSGGYLWWYIDAMSDDGQFGLSLIAFVGSVFSPYYARAIKKGLNPSPMDHCALNVALYGPNGKIWSMTERPSSSVSRSKSEFLIGPSCVHWDGKALHIDIDEWSVPLPKRVRGRVSVYPEQLFNFSTPLDVAGLHHWGPIAPHAKVHVNLSHPDQIWSGHAYVDSNEGLEPIAETFTEWDWSRSPMDDGSCCVVYDCQFLNGEDRLLSLRFNKNGVVESFIAPDRHEMPKTAWGLHRRLRSDHPIEIIKQLEDTPFYQRALVQNYLQGEKLVSFHETLNAKRFSSNWVQSLLPWRMPRLAGKRFQR